MNRHQRFGLVAGLVGFLLLLSLPSPQGLSGEGWRTAAVTFLMAIWWMTEAIPIPATALVPLVLFPALGVLDMPQAAAPYANEVIFLFMGGFVLALAMERWGLHRRIALNLVARVGTSPRRLVLGFMAATAFLSMWISNTATAAMMFPIGMAVAEAFRPRELDPGRHPFPLGIALMLGLAYASSIGGVGTLIGTPPNAVLAAAAQELLGVQIGFLEWMLVGVPLVAVFLPLGWVWLVYVLFPPDGTEADAGGVLQEERRSLGTMQRGEKIVALVFLATALAWIFREPKPLGIFVLPGIASFAPEVRDSTIAMGAAVLLFLLPVRWRSGEFVMDWAHAQRLPWGVLLLFGGGLSLARAMEQTGLARWIGGWLAEWGTLPAGAVVLLAATLFIFLTEVTSNTATATMAMPLMAGTAAALGQEPFTLMAVVALSSSMAFMLPVATPPNAIVFGSPYLTLPRMVRAGLGMNLLAILLTTLAGLFLIPAVFGH